MAKSPLSAKTTTPEVAAPDVAPEAAPPEVAAPDVAPEAAPPEVAAPEGEPPVPPAPSGQLDGAFFDVFFQDIVPVLGGGEFYQPSAWEHYAKAELSDLFSGTHEHEGWQFIFEGGKLLFAQKLPENATSGLTD